MSNFVLLLVCLGSGIYLQRNQLLPPNAYVSLNALIIQLALPALTLVQVHAIDIEPSLVYAILMPWLVFAFSLVIFWMIGHGLDLPKSTIGALTISAGLGNTSFIGVPMIEVFYGIGATPTAILIGQLGTYLVLSTVGILVICIYSESSISRWEVVKRVSTFPPLVAVVVAAALRPVEYPFWVESVLTRLGEMVTPLALLSIGMQFRPGMLKGNRVNVALGLGYKLLLAPLLIAVIYVGVIGLRGPIIQVTLFEAAMPPQVGSAIVAIQYGLKPELIAVMVAIGTVLCFLTLPVLSVLLRTV